MVKDLPVGRFRGTTVRLAPLGAEDEGFCHGLATIGDGHWPRLHGVTNWAYHLWADQLAGFRIVDNDDHWIGVASIHSPNDRHQYASFEVVGVPGADDLVLEQAGELIVEYGFDVFNYRKLYHTYFNNGPGRLKAEVREESRLIDSTLINGRYWDQVVDAIYRDDIPVHRKPVTTKRTFGVIRRVDVKLRSVMPQDSERLRSIELSPGNLVRWRYAGQIPPPPMMDEMRRMGCIDQLAITVDGEVIGLVNAHKADLASGTAWLGLVTADEWHHTGVGITAAIIFIDRLYSNLPELRKLYAEVNETNLKDFASLVRRGYAADEGCLREHVLYGGQPFDVHNLCIDREVWMEKVRPKIRRLMGVGA